MNLIQRIIVRKELDAVQVFSMTKGKTFFAGLGAILTGLGLICHALANGDWHTSGMSGWYTLLIGLGTLGVGHKIEKLTNAITAGLNELGMKDKQLPGAKAAK